VQTYKLLLPFKEKVEIIFLVYIMFLLPIQYIDHKKVNPCILQELDLIDSKETPIYHRVFGENPMASQFASYFTTNTTFLKDSVSIYKKQFPTADTSFVSHWKTLKDNKEFKLTYQYVESSWVSCLNDSPTFLWWISTYFLASPALFVLTPLLMLLFPFVLLYSKGIVIDWKTYRSTLQLLPHPLFNVLKYDPAQQMNKIGGLIFYFVQVYVNMYTLYTFSKNWYQVKKVLDSFRTYASSTLTRIYALEKMIQLDSYRSFSEELAIHKKRLETWQKDCIPTSLWNIGSNRRFFYQLYDNKEMEQTIQYTTGFHQYMDCIESIRKKMGKKLNVCTFGKETRFRKAFYPILKPVKHTYTVENMVVTGPNASGKTTFLKQTMINLLLSQQIGCGYYKSATICPFENFVCYVNIPDTCGRDSLFQAEARRCKEIMQESSKRTFCIFDELFSGTNPEEAVAAGTAMLHYLKETPMCFLLTTHFMDICHKANIKTKQMIQYQLKNGISSQKGGIQVLETMNFPSSFLKNAKELCA